jgi:hypothetical protein
MRCRFYDFFRPAPPIDPDLQSIVECWAKLPDAIKAAMLAMVQSNDNGSRG